MVITKAVKKVTRAGDRIPKLSCLNQWRSESGLRHEGTVDAGMVRGRQVFLGISRGVLLVIVLYFVSACGMSARPAPETAYSSNVNSTTDRTSSSDTPVLTLERVQKIAAEPLSPKETGEVVDTALTNFFYGPGLGETALDVTGAMLFPPYAMVLIGQTLVRLAGYESPRFIEIFPDQQQHAYDVTMDAVYSGPGRLVAAAAGEEYRTRSRVRSRWVETVEKLEANRSEGRGKFVFAASSVSTGVRPLPKSFLRRRPTETVQHAFFPPLSVMDHTRTVQ